MSDEEITALAVEIGQCLRARNALCATAESCTGGLVAGAITDIAGSSGWLDRGFVTYSNEAKMQMLDVPASTLAEHGAVSLATARAMAAGALANSRAEFSVAITGIAGPGGGTPEKPVGFVCFAWAQRGAPLNAVARNFTGDRQAIRRASVVEALRGLIAHVRAAAP